MSVALYDASALYGNVGRDLLVRAAIEGTVAARWTDEILDEAFETLTRDRPDLSPAKLDRTRVLLNAAVPGGLVTGYQGLAGDLELPDLQHRHVLAAAIWCGAQVIVTDNIRGFPPAILDPLGIKSSHA